VFESWVLVELLKSGMTYNTEWTQGLDYSSGLAGARAGHLSIVYHGRESFTHRGVQVAGWADVPATVP
jgi:hypothetical protein